MGRVPEKLRRSLVRAWWAMAAEGNVTIEWKTLPVPNSQAKRTHCPAGHPYNEKNTLRSHGRRHCRPCHARRERLRKRRNGKV